LRELRNLLRGLEKSKVQRGRELRIQVPVELEKDGGGPLYKGRGLSMEKKDLSEETTCGTRVSMRNA